MSHEAPSPLPSSPQPTRAARLRRAAGAVVVVCAATLAFAAGSAWAMSTPNLMGTASPSTTVGYQIFDHTNLMGGSNPTGTISFALFAPGDTSCTAPIFTASVPVSGTGSDDSPVYVPQNAGTYQWTTSYSGDQNNNPMSTVCGDPAESVIVGKHWVGETLTTSQNAGVLHAVFVLTGGQGTPTGNATFTVTGPNDMWCSGAPVFTSTVAVHGDGSYDSGQFRPTVPGTYTFRLRYDGDANNIGVGPTNCMDTGASATVSQALFLNPTSGHVLDMTHPINWTPVSGAQAYDLTVGTTRGGGDLANIGLPGTTTSFDVSLLPTGRILYARLWTEVGSVWVGYQDVVFATTGQGATFTSPIDGQIALTTRLSWNMVPGADMYGLWVGTAKATADVASVHLSTTTSSYDVPTMVLGQKLYARVWTRINGVWMRYQDITFTAPTV